LLGNHLLGYVGIFVGGLFSQVVLAVTPFFWLRRSIGGEAVTSDAVVPGEAGLAGAETI
jgi:hypothetical protein